MTVNFRAMQNSDEPDLPFAQSSNLLSYATFGRPNPKYQYFEYIVNGKANGIYAMIYPEMVNETHYWTESQASTYRAMGYDVRKVSDRVLDSQGNPTGTPTTTSTTGSTTTSGLSRSQVEKIIEDYHGDDIKLLHEHAISAGDRSENARIERVRIEAKVNANKAEHQDFHTKLSDLGKSVQDVSDSLNLHAVHPIIPPVNPLPPISLGLLAVIGVGAYFLLRRKRK